LRNLSEGCRKQKSAALDYAKLSPNCEKPSIYWTFNCINYWVM